MKMKKKDMKVRKYICMYVYFKIKCKIYPEVQCAAVRTYKSLITDPPQ